MTLRARLALGLFGIALVLLVPLAITLRALGQLNDEAQALRTGDFQASIILGRLREAALEVKTAETALLFVSDSASRTTLTRSLGTLQALSDSLAGFDLGAPAQRLRAAVGEVAIAVPELIDAVRRNDEIEADAIANDRTGPALQRAENGIAITERLLLVRTQERVVGIGELTEQSVTVAAVALAAAILVATMLALWLLRSIARPVSELVGRAEVLRTLRPEAFADDSFGTITVKDILAELEKPGRDPRPHFVVARFNDAVADIKDLQPGMVLEGTVSNVAQFGAFVDLGVHQDGLVHVSQLSHKFISDAREIVRTGQVVKVRVQDVDLARKRISLTMKLDAPVPAPRDQRGDNTFRPADRQQQQQRRADQKPAPAAGGAMAAAFAKLQGRS